jgi:CRISPR-associated endonuclease Cas1
MDGTESTTDTRAIRGLSTDQDIAEDAERRTEVYGQSDNHEVAVVDGFGARVLVERGHLELRDGMGQDRRIRRYSKVAPPRRVVVGVGTVGTLTLDALRWCSQTGAPVVVLGKDGAILAGGPPGRSDARLLRAQALALYGPTGVQVSRYLIAEKLGGQSRVLGHIFGADNDAATLLDLAGIVTVSARSIEEIRQLEAAGANVYFAGWERETRAVFAGKDKPRIPAHWSRFNGRRSFINPGSPRSATDPAGALLNYAYRLAEIEAGLAARRLGLDPAMGILHADAIGRPSLACDLMEPIRPVVDLHVLGLLAGPLRKRDFTEDNRGVVRCLAPLTHRLAEAMPSYAENLAPVVETVAAILASSSPYDVKVPTALTRAKHKAAAKRRADSARKSGEAEAIPEATGPNLGRIAPRGRRRPKPSVSPPLPLQRCRGCGAKLAIEANRAKPRSEWCPDCLSDRRQELGKSLPSSARAASDRFERETGTLPTQTPNARKARAVANARQRIEELAFEESSSQVPGLDAAWFEIVVQPRLSTFTLPTIAKATGVSTSAAAKWRAGRRTPHQRHWQALALLVGGDSPGASRPSEIGREGFRPVPSDFN